MISKAMGELRCFYAFVETSGTGPYVLCQAMVESIIEGLISLGGDIPSRGKDDLVCKTYPKAPLYILCIWP